jgi:hypothetical protein
LVKGIIDLPDRGYGDGTMPLKPSLPQGNGLGGFKEFKP